MFLLNTTRLIFGETHNPINALLAFELLLLPFCLNLSLVPIAFDSLRNEAFQVNIRIGIPGEQSYFRT